MMRAKLIELTAVSCVRAAKAASANSAFTMFCASSKLPWTRDVVDVRVEHRRHLTALHFGDPLMRVQHDDIDAGKAAERGDGRRARVAGRGDDHGRAPLLLLQGAREQPSQELHRDVLEREGRAMEQLEQEPIGPELDKRHDILVREARVGSVNIGAEFGVVERARHEGAHHAERDFGIGQSRERARSRVR